MVKTRSTTGRFTNSPAKASEENILDNHLPINIQKETIFKFLKFLFLILLISPWLVMAFRKHSVENISKGIVDFYDDNFSCNSYCHSMSNSTDFSNISSKEKTKKDNF